MKPFSSITDFVKFLKWVLFSEVLGYKLWVLWGLVVSMYWGSDDLENLSLNELWIGKSVYLLIFVVRSLNLLLAYLLY